MTSKTPRIKEPQRPVANTEEQAVEVIGALKGNYKQGDRLAIGIDVAADVNNWGVSVIRLASEPTQSRIEAIFPQARLKKDGKPYSKGYCRPTISMIETLLQWTHDQKIPTAIAVDVPFGWPVQHLAFLQNFTAEQGWTSSEEPPQRQYFERRLCDLELSRAFMENGITPLSVSADTLGQVAYTWVRKRVKLGNLLGRFDFGLDGRLASGVRCFETYPAAFIRLCFPDFCDYKSDRKKPIRRALVEALLAHYSVRATDPSRAWCEWACNQSGSPDALDSMLCAFCAWDYLESQMDASGIEMTTPAQVLRREITDEERRTIKSEGWILVRKPSPQG